MITVRGYEIRVNIRAEIENYEWQRPRWTEKNFIACSPFRNEKNPSFAIHLERGVWLDSGSHDPEWNKGEFVKLLSWLRNETFEETADYLLQKYGSKIADPDSLTLNLNLTEKKKPSLLLDPAVLQDYSFRHPYLAKQRGISEKYQRAFHIGYDRKSRAITFPWFDKVGQLVNIKFRSVHGKMFWYFLGGQPVRNHIYGLNVVYKVNAERVFIVESEIDAITLWQAGFPAVALGGANLCRQQRNLLIQSPIRKLVLATDNDRAGQKIAQEVTDQMGGFVELEQLQLPDHVKDVNDLSRGELLKIIDGMNTFQSSFLSGIRCNSNNQDRSDNRKNQYDSN
ncbi:toprim domain-containing protein [Heliophilum fasciatum]|uniref:CHC2-type zinc finger protein n=1 Tax=Heliophilum fasciatum TaxID=35700 RepID=A0A4R2RTN7_9FIRM|nr:toprim domain-containing protein [Heliophilum fasciatum]MCW2278756.1 5S rRNA maturation endonuclease (ribonuclease M5) [Heliophilum fasciatum]TCP62505.1 CHC2-type zinc finger protein [Heliophilum fasciatum]